MHFNFEKFIGQLASTQVFLALMSLIFLNDILTLTVIFLGICLSKSRLM